MPKARILVGEKNLELRTQILLSDEVILLRRNSLQDFTPGGRVELLGNRLTFTGANFNYVSKVHGQLNWNGSLYTITDDDSSYGTRINDRKISRAVPVILNTGDEVELGQGAYFTIFYF